MPQPAAALSITNMDEPTSFFFSLSPFLFFSSRLPWLVISLSACSHVPARELFSSLSPSSCVGAQQNAWPWNRFVKCADTYIVRRKCRIQWRWLHSQWIDWWVLIKINKIVGHRRVISFGIVWDAATCGGTLNYQHDEPTFFFSSSLSKLLTGDFLVDLLNLEEESLPQTSRGSGNTGWRGRRRRAWKRKGGRFGPRGQRQGQARNTQRKSCSREGAGIGRSQKNTWSKVRSLRSPSVAYFLELHSYSPTVPASPAGA